MGRAEQSGSVGLDAWHSSDSKSMTSSRKRKAAASSDASRSGKVVIDLTADSPPSKKRRQTNQPDEERRLRRWRARAPASYTQIRDRALYQRMFVLDRDRDTSNPECPKETVTMAGTTGNVYTIVIDKVPSCDCPHAIKGNQCKHIVYVLARVLRVPPDLEYQLAFVSTELQQIFAHAPPLPTEQGKDSEKDGNRKPMEGEECPICCVDFEPDNSEQVVVYCKAACGNNIHLECFQKWAATKRDGPVTCPFCRTPWQGDEETLKSVARSGKVNEEGYANVASQLGLSGERDYSNYHSFWVQRHFGRNW